MFLTETIGSAMAEGIQQGIDVGLDLLWQGIVDFATQNPILAIAVVLIVLFGGKATSTKRR